jgi:AcrR family transcriptional regulator
VDQAARSAKIRHILDSARICFARDGFHRAGTADICREAGISPANLYQYFSSKDDIIVAIAEEYRSDDLALLAEIDRRGPLPAAITTGFDELAAEIESDQLYPRLRLEILAEATRNPRVRAVVSAAERDVQTELTRMIAAAQAKGELARTLAADDLASLILALYDGVFARHVALGVAMPLAGMGAMLRKVLEVEG